MKNSRILLVEDSPSDETLMLLALKDAKITNEVDIVRDGEEALNFLLCEGQYASRDKNILPHLILLDLKLPKIDGMDVLKTIRSNSRTKRIPVVVLTSSREENDLVKSYDNGANSFVVKPMDPDLFVAAIEQVGLYWLIVNTSATPGE